MKWIYNTFFADRDCIEAIFIAGTIGISVGLLVGLPIAIIAYFVRLALGLALS